MALDIRKADLLDDGTTRFNILVVDEWPRRRFGSAWLSRLSLPVTIWAGRDGAPFTLHIAGLRALPPVPVTGDFLLDEGMDPARQVKQTFIKSPGNDVVYALTLGDMG